MLPLLPRPCCSPTHSHRPSEPLHLQSGGWTVTLEGVCRLRVRGVHLSRRPPVELFEAVVEQLDYLPPRTAGTGTSSSGAAGGGGGKDQEELVQELLKVRKAGAWGTAVCCCAELQAAGQAASCKA